LLEWLAPISEEHERELRELQRLEANARAAEERYEQLIEFLDLQEAQWDPGKHPRRGTPPNPGWFAPTGGAASATSSSSSRRTTGIGASSGSSTSIASTRTATVPKTARIDATQEPTSSPRSKVQAAPADYSGPKQIVAQQASSRSASGHHWVPRSTFSKHQGRMRCLPFSGQSNSLFSRGGGGLLNDQEAWIAQST
jgi:hypothetical protein